MSVSLIPEGTYTGNIAEFEDRTSRQGVPYKLARVYLTELQRNIWVYVNKRKGTPRRYRGDKVSVIVKHIDNPKSNAIVASGNFTDD